MELLKIIFSNINEFENAKNFVKLFPALLDDLLKRIHTVKIRDEVISTFDNEPFKIIKNTSEFRYVEYPLKNGEINGLVITRFQPNPEISKIVEIVPYIDGKANGQLIKWNVNGKKVKQGVFRDGKEVGTWYEWLSGGKYVESNYTTGEKIFWNAPGIEFSRTTI